MLTPAARHRLKVAAAEESVATADSAVSGDRTEYENQLLQLAQFKRRLKEIQSIERKIAAKAEMLPAFDPYLDGVLEADVGGEDIVLTTTMIWNIDTGNLDRALELGEYALAHNLTMPEQYRRDTATTLAEELADHVLKDDNISAQMPLVSRVIDLTADHDMPDEVKAKLYKAMGKSLVLVNKAKALDRLKRALELHGKVGVKKDIEKLERDLKKESKSG